MRAGRARRSIATASLLGSATPTAEPSALGMAALSVPADAAALAATPADAAAQFAAKLGGVDLTHYKERKGDDQIVLSLLRSVSDSDGEDTPARDARQRRPRSWRASR